MFTRKILYKIFISIPIVTISSLYTYIEIKSKSNKLESRLNIIFDLDETLIYTDKINNYNNYNNKNLLEPESFDILSNRKIWIRPWIYPIIPILSKFNNLYLFTKATEPYTIDILYKTNLDKYFIEKKFRNDCKNTCKDINKFISIKNSDKIINSLLVDDKISNKCENQSFYHIPKFNYFIKYDYELVKLFTYIIWLNIITDIKSNDNYKN